MDVLSREDFLLIFTGSYVELMLLRGFGRTIEKNDGRLSLASANEI
jgi:hypothetical protein